MKGWRQFWMLASVLYALFVWDSARTEWPTQEQVMKRWNEARRRSRPEGCGGAKYVLDDDDLRPCPENVDRRHRAELERVRPGQNAVIVRTLLRLALMLAATYGACWLLLEVSVRDWHPGQLAIVYAAGGLAESVVYAGGGGVSGASDLGLLLFLGIPVSVLVLTWKWFDARKASR